MERGIEVGAKQGKIEVAQNAINGTGLNCKTNRAVPKRDRKNSKGNRQLRFKIKPGK